MATIGIADRPYVAVPARSAITVRFAGLAVLCAATLVAPALLLVWMPIVLGVPHVANDIRFLVLPLPRRQALLALGASALLVALEAASIATGADLLRIEVAVVAAWLLATLVLEPGCRKRALGIALFASALIVGLPIAFVIVAAFAHNFVAVIAWLVVARPRRRHALLLVGGLVGFVLIAAFLGPITSAATGGDNSLWLTIDAAASAMFAGMPHGVARGLLIGFAFLQGVHYAIWLGWIPESQRMRTNGTLTKAKHPAARYGSIVVACATITVIGAAFVDPAWTRTTYLALATFHIYLELVLLAARWAGRRTA